MRTLLLALAVGALSACATETAYQPAGPGSDGGYREQQIESNRVRISFSGNSLTDRETVENYLLYRAAELTLQQGKDYFIIADRDTHANSRLVATDFDHSPFGYRFFSRRHGWAPFYDPFWDDPTEYREVTRYEAFAEITMHSGHKPADNPNAFDAHEVQANLQGRIVRPPPAH
ncbi:MAG: hypothetical protein HY054_07230 [Proteobacteria bacterium]|nr:hypothetical protein [Pseudomonadota bacterium]